LAKTATHFSRLLGLPVAAGSKQRLADDRVVIDAVVGDVEGRHAIVLDDEIATGGSIIELIRELNADGATILMITHDTGLADQLPRQIRMLDGQVVADTARGPAP